MTLRDRISMAFMKRVIATPEGRAQAERIRVFLDGWDRSDGGVPSCPLQ